MPYHNDKSDTMPRRLCFQGSMIENHEEHRGWVNAQSQESNPQQNLTKKTRIPNFLNRLEKFVEKLLFESRARKSKQTIRSVHEGD